MKMNVPRPLHAAVLVATLMLAAAPVTALAQLETAFTYQGRLVNTNGPLDGQFDFIFALYDDAGAQMGGTLTNLAVPVTEGYFIRTLDFGPNSFRRYMIAPREFVGPGEWLEISVRTNRSKTYETLSPRQRITPTPFASTVTRPLPSGAIEGNYYEKVTFANATNVFVGSYYGDGANLTNVNTADLWKLTGNAGTIPGANYLGTADNQALELRVNGGRALRLEPNATSPNLLGGYAGNVAGGGDFGAVVAGGGSSTDSNRVSASYGVVGGGSGNTINSTWAAVGGGKGNTVQGNSGNTVIGGGWLNTIGQDAGESVIGGGTANQVGTSAARATISGGSFQQATGTYATLSGGERNQAGAYGSIGGGFRNAATGNYSVAGGGNTNTASGLYSVVSGGHENTASASSAAVGGGEENVASGSRSTVAGGWRNVADGSYSTIGGGRNNSAIGINSAVAGGSFNTVSGISAIVLGGQNNVAGAAYSLAAGYYATAAHERAFIWNGDGEGAQSTTAAGQFKVHAPGGAAFYTGADTLFASGEMSCRTLNIRGGADLAEPFAMSGDSIQPGAVVVIDPEQPGRLKLSTGAYDRKVAGIVSGAGGVQPGISMTQADRLEEGRNVALSGRVYALVDASKNAVRPGDLLTTSDTPGHAMKAENPALAQGAILGKAMTPLAGGRGLVLVLVSLQ